MDYKVDDKYRSMKRAFERLREYSELKIRPIQGNTEANDAAEDFFVQCWHLKDWLISNRLVSEKLIDKYIEDSKYLKVAKIYCNSFKHGGPERNCKDEQKINGRPVHVEFSIVSGSSVMASRSSADVIIGDTRYNTLDVALGCIEEWDTFIKDMCIDIK